MSKRFYVVLIVLSMIGVGFMAFNIYSSRTQEEVQYEDVVDDFSLNGSDSNVVNDDTELDTSNAAQANNDGDTEDSSSTILQDNSESTEDKKNVSVILTRATQQNSEVLVEGFAQILEKDGKCNITITHIETNKIVQESVNTDVQPNYTQCNPTYIPKAKLGVAGTWKASIQYISNGYSGVSNSIDFEVSL